MRVWKVDKGGGGGQGLDNDVGKTGESESVESAKDQIISANSIYKTYLTATSNEFVKTKPSFHSFFYHIFSIGVLRMSVFSRFRIGHKDGSAETAVRA